MIGFKTNKQRLLYSGNLVGKFDAFKEEDHGFDPAFRYSLCSSVTARMQFQFHYYHDETMKENREETELVEESLTLREV